MKQKLRIGITIGDFNGIGPEVALKAVHQGKWPRNVEFICYGSHRMLACNSRRFRLPMPDGIDPDPEGTHGLRWRPGIIDAEAGRQAALAIRDAVTDCLAGKIDAIVTAPVSKEGMHRAGFDFPGQTEYLARLTKTKRYAMMLFGGTLRVVIATRHIPLADVPKTVTRRLLREQITLAAEGLAWLGARQGRVAVCGLNPHAGEGGDIGREEIKVISPAVRSLRKEGLEVYGPLAGDTVFHAAAKGQYGAVVAMYHDQGLAPLKLIAFDSGVNLTLGLPVVRTSPDHGTAYDIAGRNKAGPGSMIQAIRTAILLAGRKNPWAKK